MPHRQKLLGLYETLKSSDVVSRQDIERIKDVKDIDGLNLTNLYTQEASDAYYDETIDALEKELNISGYTTESELMDLQPIASSIVSALSIIHEDGVVLPEDTNEVFFTSVYDDNVVNDKEEIIKYITEEASQDYASIWGGIISKDRSSDIPLTSKEARFISNIKNELIFNYI